MDRIKLITPDESYAQELMAYRQEFLDTDGNMAGCGILRECTTPEQWFAHIRKLSSIDTCPPDRVPSSSYLAIRESDNRLVGITDLRHHIDHPVLGVWGGHIGYSVRPSERRKGYAKEMLRQNLENCRALGLTKVLITCDRENIASERTILANGGQFEKEVCGDGKHIKRYWITL